MRGTSDRLPSSDPFQRRAILVGECPGPGIPEEKAHPLFPLPERSSGGRLLRVIGWGRNEYLRRFDRSNLFRSHQPKWSADSARDSADALVESVLEGGGLVDFVLLGARVSAAFQREDFDPMVSLGFWGGTATVVPHPSGLNRWYNEPVNRAAVRRLFAGFREGRSRSP